MINARQYATVLKQMAKVVKASPTFFDPYFNGKPMPKDWYKLHEWTEEQEDQFKKWLIQQLAKWQRGYSKGYCRTQAEWFLFEYGWTYKKEE